MKSAVLIRPGKIDRSPTGTAVFTRLGLLAARSPSGGQIEGRIVGTHRHMFEGAGPQLEGFRLSDISGAVILSHGLVERFAHASRGNPGEYMKCSRRLPCP